jgi:hypothetical protein
MAKPKSAEDSVIDEVKEDFDYENPKFKTMDDYDKYNKWARKNKIPVKVPTEDFYKKRRCKFQRMDAQKENVLKVRKRCREIDWQGQLKHGGIYYLCDPIITFLNTLATPIFAQVDVNDGGPVRKETKQVGEECRFSCQVLDFL